MQSLITVKREHQLTHPLLQEQAGLSATLQRGCNKYPQFHGSLLNNCENSSTTLSIKLCLQLRKAWKCISWEYRCTPQQHKTVLYNKTNYGKEFNICAWLIAN
jgi:hypothetical protein